MDKTDLNTADNIIRFVDLFYQKIFQDGLLAPIFTEVAKVNVLEHKQHIYAYWQKLLLADPAYQRNTMEVHRRLNDKQRLRPEEYRQWLALFKQTADEGFSGAYTERAVKIAENIAGNMEDRLYHQRQPEKRTLDV